MICPKTIAEMMEIHGCGIRRAFERSDIPLTVLTLPDLPLRLADHYSLLGNAARAVGDPVFGATLGQGAQTQNLGYYGQAVSAAPTLALALERAGELLNEHMQTNTDLVWIRRADHVVWSMVFHTPGHAGRFQNELLAVSYQLSTLRFYLGATWRPRLIRIIGGNASIVRLLEPLFQAPVQCGHAQCGIEFPLAELARPRPNTDPGDLAKSQGAEQPMPQHHFSLEELQALVQIEALQAAPQLSRLAGRLGLSSRSFQRKLTAAGFSYSQWISDARYGFALRALPAADMSIAQISDSLGYSSPAHFTRAFRRWAGQTPSDYRRALPLA